MARKTYSYCRREIWPYIVAAVLFGVSFIPQFGWLNVILFIPFFFFWILLFMKSDKSQSGARFVGFIFTFINAGVSIYMQLYYAGGAGR
jgi:FtsH-binding integral membrane protein